MTTTSWIVVAVVAVAVLALVAVLARAATRRRRTVRADHIREEIAEEGRRLDRREAVAAETEAKARAAQAEAARLQERAAGHRETVDSTRERLDARREQADALDPRVGRGGREDAPDRVVIDDPRAVPTAETNGRRSGR
jgi:biopolymer transport protein ExbB/TolQ